MKTWYAILFLLLTSATGFANVWQGDYIINQQADADAFRNVCACTSINGSLTIAGNDVQHVDSLYELTDVRESVEIVNTWQFNNFNGLRHILNIKQDLIIRNNLFKTIKGFESLQQIGRHFEIVENEHLERINGFGNLKEVFNNFEITSNPKLKSLTLFKSLETLNQLHVSKNESLNSIIELDVLTEIDYFSIANNDMLRQIEGFNQVEYCNTISIRSNLSLQFINTFQKLVTATNFQLHSNDQLEDLNGFNQLKSVSRFELGLPKPLLQGNHFKNLTTVHKYCRTNFSEFEKLDSVGIFQVVPNEFLKIDTLTGPSSLKKVGTILISQNEQIKHIKGFNSLEKIAQLRVDNNKNLHTIEGFNQLKSIQKNADISFFLGGYFGYFVTSSGMFYTEPSMIINYNPSLKTIKGFSNLDSVYSYLAIGHNNNLASINGFNKLKYSTSLEIVGNINLESITGFQNLSSTILLSISGNANLNQLTGFINLISARDLNIAGNTNLQEINAFENLKDDVPNIYISNSNLLQIHGFEKINRVGSLVIENRNLRILKAFTNLKIIDNLWLTNNIHLKSINNFSNVEIIKDGLTIENNVQLNDCCIFNCLSDSFLTYASISNNGTNCSSWQMIKENCSENNCTEKENLLSDLKIQNNPITQQLEFSFITFEEQPIDYTIYSISDQLLAKGSIDGIIGYNRKVIDLPSIQKGFYFLVVNNEETKVFRKFVKL